MNIQELDAYNLDDAVKFNDHLNPALWDSNEHLKPEIKAQLLLIAEDFKESLGIKDLDLKDIVISGSNAAYTYTPNSDIDLHLVVDQPEDPVYRELFDAKKGQYNDAHDIKIKGFDVEVYVEAADKPAISQGTYSLLQDKWLQVPRRVKSNVDDTATRNKFETIGHAVERAIKSGNRAKMDRMARKIKKMRQTGLEQHGEFGPENLAFKMLRSQGLLQRLHDARIEEKNKELSLKERKKPGSVFTYGFKHEAEDIKEPEITTEAEESIPSDEEILKDFIHFCVNELKIETMPTIKLRKDPQWSVVNKTFGRYTNDRHMLEVAWGQRHIMDVLRTVAHELTHKHQHERDGEKMGNDAGETGSPWENEANARAGILMRDYGRLNPELFDAGETELEESASGYIPTKKQAKDPRFSMALTQDIKPGQLGKEANKLKLKTNSQGAPQVARANGLFEQLMMEYQLSKEGIQAPVNRASDAEQYYKFIMAKHKLGRPLTRQEQEFARAHQMLRRQVAESIQISEVRMAPSNLQQFANSPEAEGIQAGFEAELIFRDTINDEDGGDMEPDYDADERCSSIDEVIDFFNNGEYGGLSQRQESRLRDELDERYYEWFDNQMYAEWQDNQDEPIRDAWLEERPMDERIHDALTDGLGLTDEQADAAEDLHARRVKGAIKGSDLSEEELDLAQQYSEARSIAEDVLDEDVQTSIEKQDKIYDSALEEFRDGFSIDNDREFWDDTGLRWMSDVANEYDLDWPYLQGGNNGGSRDWESIGDSLHSVVDMPVKVSSGYHSATRKPGLWIVEPDSSLDPDDREDYGLEIVSPPMPLKQALEQLEAVTEWANSDGDAYTNSSTGLHMGVSIPYKEGRVDYLKLILFLGDEYVLQQYGREANTYTKAAMKDIKSRAGNEKNATAVLELLRNNLSELAERELVKSTGEGKYTSAHKKDKYIEFRSAGGDWLAEANAEPGKLENTMMRYAYAMYLAGNPGLERREYAKKLYKLVSGAGNDSTMALFSQYAAGEIDKDQLKKRWAEKVLDKTDSKGNKKSRWKLYNNDTRQAVPGQEYNGYTYDEARAKAKEKISPSSSEQAFDKAYTLRDVGEGSNQWRVYRADTGKTLEIINAEHRGEAVDDAYEKYSNVVPFKVEPYNPDVPEKDLNPRAKLAKRITKGSQKQNWDVVYKPTGRVIDGILQVDAEEAQRLLSKVADQHQFANTDDLELRPESDEADPDVEQNFNTDLGDWEFYRTETGQVIDRVTNANRMQANAVRADIVRRYGHPDSSVGMRLVNQTPAPSANPNPTAPIEGQVRMPNGVPVWELFDIDTMHALHAIADHTAREAYSQGMAWLRSYGAEDPDTYGERFAIRPKMLATGEQNTAGTQTPATSGARQVPSQSGPNGEEPNYEVYMQRYPNGGALKRFYAATHPEAMDYLGQYRRQADGAPSEYAIRNL